MIPLLVIASILVVAWVLAWYVDAVIEHTPEGYWLLWYNKQVDGNEVTRERIILWKD